MNQTSTFVMSSYDSLNFYFYSLQDSLFSVKLTSSSTPPTFSMSYKYQTPVRLLFFFFNIQRSTARSLTVALKQRPMDTGSFKLLILTEVLHPLTLQSLQVIESSFRF